MSNVSSQHGQLQRSGVQRLISDRKGKKRKKIRASRILESMGYNRAFTEKGFDERDKSSGQKTRVFLCTIIEEGLGNSKDKNFYSAQALQSGTKVFNGAKAYADHPDAITEKTLPERSMKDLVGWYSDCFVDKNPDTGKTRLRGKLHFFQDAKWLTDKIDTILTDPTAKGLFGISINAVGKTRQASMGGEEVNYVEEFQRVDSADVVTEPAARGKFDKMLESRRSKVNRIMAHKSKRTREAASLSPEKLKEVADSLVSAYNSDNPDETKEAAFAAARVLHAASSVSGKGPGQSNEEQYSNISPNGGRESMARNKNRRMKTSTGSAKRGFRKGKRRLQAAAGTGEDNEHVDEPDEGDIEGRLEEADVEDEEERGDIGDQKEHGSGKYHQVKASREALEDEGLEDEGFEDEGVEDEGLEGMEDEGFEDEGLEDEMGGEMPPGAQGGGMPGAGQGGPAGGGAPGSSRTVASAEADDDEGMDDDDDDLDDMDESFEDESMERPNVIAEGAGRRRSMMTSRRRHGTREADGSSQGGSIKKASYAGGLGHSGHSPLPKGADPTRGYDDSDEDYGKKDDSTSGVGKSYKLKTSRFARNRRMARVAKPIVREANRRIEFLTDRVMRLRESSRRKDEKIDMYRGKLRFIESERSARRLLREAVDKEILPENAPSTLYKTLLGLGEKQQIRKIKEAAYFIETATEGAAVRMRESVDGSGARGGFASWGSAGQNSELVDGLADLGVPMLKDEN